MSSDKMAIMVTEAMNHQGEKIVVGMSGGVDSSMALVLLKEQGWQPVGLSLKYAVWRDLRNLFRENVCCSSESFRIARKICQQLKVPHYTLDVSKDFKKEVIDYFIEELKHNRTPNPCIVCNRRLKFKKLFEWGRAQKIPYVATGHYARIGKNVSTSKYELVRAKDKWKDQTYSLCLLPQEWLGHTVFPLGGLTKKEVYQMAQGLGFEVFLKRKESQDFCFVSGNCLNCFLEEKIGRKPGPIKDIRGRVLGEHSGLHFYTLGQRKGIELPHGPYYVQASEESQNALIVTKDKKDLLSFQAILAPIHFISGQSPKEEIRVAAKIRYHQAPAEAVLTPLATNKARLTFAEPQRAVTPGQFAVFYQNEVCLGGGRIIKSET